MRKNVAAVAALVFLLSGCTSGSSPTTSGDDIVTITDPADTAYLQNATNAAAPHLHDYWAGGDRLVVLEDEQKAALGFAGGDQDLVALEFRPGSDQVIPQGAASVEVQIDIQSDPTDMYGELSLWVKTAAEQEPVLVAPFVSGDLLTIASTNEKNDLPHQRLSAWIFEVHVTSAETGMLRYQATVAMRVEAVRGLEIPLYPGHPDVWAGRNEIPLLDVTGQDIYFTDPGTGGEGCSGFDCFEVLVPEPGATVPTDTAVVLVTLELGDSPTTLGLSYHGADTREFERIEPNGVAGTTRTYEIYLDSNGDGPYAKASLWEFLLFIDGPAADVIVAQDYHITAVAKRVV